MLHKWYLSLLMYLPSCVERLMELIPWDPNQCMLCFYKCSQHFLEVRRYEIQPHKVIMAGLEMSEGMRTSPSLNVYQSKKKEKPTNHKNNHYKRYQESLLPLNFLSLHFIYTDGNKNQKNS